MIIRTSIAKPGMFDTFVIIDWSAANQPNTGRDSIWICAVDRDGVQRLIENPRTRHGAKNLLGGLLSEATARGERVLLGFDFPFGYPAGFAARLGLNASPPWRAVWLRGQTTGAIGTAPRPLLSRRWMPSTTRP